MVARATVHVWRRGQLPRDHFLLPPRRFQGSNSGHQPWVFVIGVFFFFFFLIEDEFFPSLVVLSSPMIHSSRLELTHSVVGVSVFARHWIGPSAPGLRCPCSWSDTQEQPLHRGARRSTQSLVGTGGR